MVAVIVANGKPLKGRKTPLDLKVLLPGCVHYVLMYQQVYRNDFQYQQALPKE